MHFDRMLQVMRQVLTNQCALFRSRVISQLTNFYMTLPPELPPVVVLVPKLLLLAAVVVLDLLVVALLLLWVAIRLLLQMSQNCQT